MVFRAAAGESQLPVGTPQYQERFPINPNNVIWGFDNLRGLKLLQRIGFILELAE